MFVKIFGYIWLAFGILFLLRPQILKNRLQKKGLKRVRKYFVLLALALGGLLISVGFKFQGTLAKILMIFGILSAFKGLFFLNAKTSDKIVEWSAALPIIYFRIGACVYIAIGVILLTLR